MQIVCEGVRLVGTEVRVDAADGHVHLRHFPGVGVCLLPVNGDGPAFVAVGLDKLGALHEHAARTAGGVVHAAVLVGLEDFDQGAHDARWRVEFAALLPFDRCELRNAIFVGAAKQVLALFHVAHVDVVREDVHHVAQNLLVQIGVRVVLGEHILECLVFGFDELHRVVYHHTDFGLVGVCRDVFPAGLRRHKEHVLFHVGVTVVFESVTLFYQSLVAAIERTRNVAQKDKPDNHLAVFRGGDMPPQDASRVPNLLFESDIRLSRLFGRFCHKKFLIYWGKIKNGRETALKF